MKARLNVFGFNHNQFSTLCLCMFIQIVHTNNVIKLDSSYYLNEASIDYHKINQVKARSLVYSRERNLNKAQLLQNVTIPSSSLFNGTLSPEKLLTMKLVLAYGHHLGQLYEPINLIFRFTRPIMKLVNERLNKLGINVLLMDNIVLDQNYTYLEDDLELLKEYRATNWPQYENYTFFLVSIASPSYFAYSVERSVCLKKQPVAIAHVSTLHLIRSASMLTHGLGKIIGLKEDDKTCECPDDFCLMNGLITIKSYDRRFSWSDCSINNIKDLYMSGEIECLLDQPPENHYEYCGNGLIDGPNEQCDCGNITCGICCGGQACKLTMNSICGSGSCCNISACNFYEAYENILCRNVVSECDLPEHCNGTSAQCPVNAYVHDGTPCEGGEGYCYQGLCRSHAASCKSIFGNGSVEKGNIACYEASNNTIANSTESDIECGTLFCNGPNGTQMNIAYSYESSFFVSQDGHNCLFLKPNQNVQKGLHFVANGSPCGNQSLCINHRCTPLSEVQAINPCPSSCPDNDTCDNLGRCYSYTLISVPVHPSHRSNVSWIDTIVSIELFIFILLLSVAIYLRFESTGGFKIFVKTQSKDTNPKTEIRSKSSNLVDKPEEIEGTRSRETQLTPDGNALRSSHFKSNSNLAVSSSGQMKMTKIVSTGSKLEMQSSGKSN